METEHQGFFRMMKEIKTMLTPHTTNITKHRVGGKWDGSYVIADLTPDVCYSYGSNDDIKFENGLYDAYKTPSIVFDHTIEGITNKPEYITFHKKGLFTAEDLMIHTSDYKGQNALLKMDIEGSEWRVYAENPDLSKFKQIVCELHFFGIGYKYYPILVEALKNLTKHHTPIHVHGTRWPINPWLDINFPVVIEVTLLDKNLVNDEFDMGDFPNELDWDFDEEYKFPECSWWKSNFHRLI